MMDSTTCVVLDDIFRARMVAEEKHGADWHQYPIWISLMTEELGKAAKEAHKVYWCASHDYSLVDTLASLRNELVDLAQLAVAAIEQIDLVPVPPAAIDPTEA